MEEDTSSGKKKYNFRAVLNRLQQTFQVLTQEQIAKTLGVSKGAVNACIQRESVPDSWLMSLYLKYHLNPRWLLWGDKHKMFLTPTDEAPNGDDKQGVHGQGGEG